MFIPWNHPSVRLTGRWSRLESDITDPHIFNKPTARYTAATAPGSYLEAAFKGERALLKFDIGFMTGPMPHLWVSVDGGAKVEVPLDRYLAVEAEGEGTHVVKVFYKGAMEMLARWHSPLTAAVCFLGYDAEDAGELPPDDRPLMEALGDSITEGVLLDTDYDTVSPNKVDQFNRPYQDDNLATYPQVAAKKLNFRCMSQAYGATGLTREGCGAVPRAGLTYPYVVKHVEYTGEAPDYVIINHGTNDFAAPKEEFLARYGEYVELIHSRAPKAQIVILTPFNGAHFDDLKEFYTGCALPYVHFISTQGWLPKEPLHPVRKSHFLAGQLLAEAMKREFGL